MAPTTLTLNVTAAEAALMRASAHGLIGVKLDALAHAPAADVGRHRAELIKLERIAAQLAQDAAVIAVTGSERLLLEIVHDAALVVAERVVEGLLTLDPGGDVSAIQRDATATVRLLDLLTVG